MKNILITGGAGFIGGHLAEALLKEGRNVIAADNFSTGSMANLAKAAEYPGLEIVTLDVVSDDDELGRLIERSDAVIHLAAAVGVELVVNDPVRTITTNVKGTENVLRHAARCNKRTIIASTSEVYGKSAKDEFSENDDLLIGCPDHSRWSYACSKLLDEFLLMAFHSSCGLPGTVVRFFNTVGPRQTGMYGMVVPRFVEKALRGEALQVYGDGGQSRCFCHVLDVVQALLLLLEEPASYGRVFNIGSQHSITILELAEFIIARLGSTSTVEMVPYDKAYAAGFEDMYRRMPDNSRIRELTGWQVKRPLEEIIDDVAAEIRSRIG